MESSATAKRRRGGRRRSLVESGGLVDDSNLPEVMKEKNPHLYELTSFSMLVLFVAMSGILACFAKFNVRTAVVFCVNLALLVIVRIFRQPAVQNTALCLSIVMYSVVVATQSSALGYTINFFWPVPFMFLLTGFRFIVLCAMALFTFFTHVFYVQFTDALYFELDTRTFAFSLDIVFFFLNLFLGICIYVVFFILGQTAWRLREFPHESLDLVPSLEDAESITYSQLPMGLVFGESVLSEEQHLLILLRLAQHSPYRDLLLQLSRSTKKELKTMLESTLMSPSAIAMEKTLSQIGEAKPVVSKSGNGLEATNELEIIRRPELLKRSLSDLHEESESETEFTNLRTFLRSAICQLVLETHPNRNVCEAILAQRDFHCSRQQIEAALLAFNMKHQKIFSPRIRMNLTVMRLWGSISPKQEEELPSSYQEFLLPGFQTMMPRFECDVLPPGQRQKRTPVKRIQAMYRKFTNVLDMKSKRFDRETEDRRLIPAPTIYLLKKSAAVSQAESDLAELGEDRSPSSKMKSATEKKRRLTESRAVSLENLDEESDKERIKRLKTVDFLEDISPSIRRSSSRPSRLNLIRLVQEPESPFWKPSLLIAILGLERDEKQWIPKDRTGFLQDKKLDIREISELGSAEYRVVREGSKDREGKIGVAEQGAMADSRLTTEVSIRHRGRTRESLRTSKLPRLTSWESCKMDRWQFFQHCLYTLFTFRLVSPTARPGRHLMMPSRWLGGAFPDLKIERWYLSWSTYVEAFMFSKMRITFIVLTFICISLTVGQMALHYSIAAGQTYLESSEIT